MASKVPNDPNLSPEMRRFLDDLSRGDPVVLVANLPSAGVTGRRAFVTNSNATLAVGIGNVVAGGGTDRVPVYDDGTDWRIG